MQNELVCWQCGASLANLSLPFTRHDECRCCRASLHACKLCRFYDIAVAKHCREPVAEEVRDKTRVNYCDYFEPRPAAYAAQSGEAEAAKGKLDALFGGGARSNDAAPQSAADRAKAELDRLFGK